VFPFTALVGQERLKRALVLTAINPRIGGVLVRGERGTAKSTAVRALANLLPDIAVIVGCRYQCDPGAPEQWCDDCRARFPSGVAPPVAHRRVPLVALPVGATEDRVLGTLELERALQSGERHFEPGLLAAANRGILYVDEVNLLPDHLVDVLLDAAAMGVNYVEREGISVRHPAQFVLVGTMNPEEGDLRPQLLDRFALAVEVAGLRAPGERAEVVRRRIAFEADPAGFAATWEAAEAAERARIGAARARLPRVVLDERLLGLIAQLCCDFEVDGLRADIVMYKTAITLAAYAGRERVTEADVREAAELALLHRRRRQPFEQPALDRERLAERIQDYLARHPEPQDEPLPGGPSGTAPPEEGEGPDEPAGDGAERVIPPAPPAPPPTLAAPAPRRPARVLRGRRSPVPLDPVQAPAGGAYVRAVPAGERRCGSLALDATLRAAAPHQVVRRAFQPLRPARLLLDRADLHLKVRQVPLSNLILFVVDASGSMAARDRMAAAKGAALGLLLDAYRRRDEVGLVAFRGAGAELLLPPTRSVELAAARLARLPTGGRTPLAAGLALACRTLERHRATRPGALPLVVLISDGRANVGLHEPSGGDAAGWLAELAVLGQRLRQQEAATVVIDSETGPWRLGLARRIATVLDARYLALGELTAASIARAVREVRV
jgi:magnesium chelatase subunit D